MAHTLRQIELAYGRRSFELTFDEARFSVLTTDRIPTAPLKDYEVGAAIDDPIASPPIDELVSSDDSVLIVVSDATRATGSAQIVNLLTRRLVQAGVSPARMAVIFATGIHRPVTEQEKIELLTSFILQRLKILTHDAYDQTNLSRFGKTESGVTVELNSALKEYSRVFLTGGITFHYFAGFTGGRKSICPGLASAKTIEATHMLALDFETGGRRAGVRAGALDGNAVHEECDRIASLVAPAFSINTIVNETKEAARLYTGDWRAAHREACDYYLDHYSTRIPSKRNIVIVSCGGFPHDINLIQAHKALDMAALACNDGGTIILLAECSDGLGRADFLKWFDARDARALAARLVNGYEVNGQTAWALLTKAERFRVCLVSELPADDVRRMRMLPVQSIDEALAHAGNGDGYIMPRGAALLPQVEAT
ncbi:MAG TPA: nickel-dependent lactate racemase [Pyrinomonadaceae bacterium]|nr:nickel-dependent lactate racemase [Pyrinomonadaceae bacterium]